MIRRITWGAVILFAASAAACGNSPSSTGTAPSVLTTVASTGDSGGTLSTFKEGNGKGKGPGTTPTTPTPPTDSTTPTGPAPGSGEGTGEDAGHGHNQTQIEGMALDVTDECPTVTILINGQTVKTDETTDFQRGTCEQVAVGQRLHIAGTMNGTDFIASYVRIQGPKPGDDEGDGDEDSSTTPTTPTTGTTPTT